MSLIPIPYKTPRILKKLFPSYTWDLKHKDNRALYLTFDDGPIPEVTEFVLSCLKEYHAKATFFCIGENVKKHPNIARQIISEDHVIGNHTMNHVKAWKTNTEAYISNTKECKNSIEKTLGQSISKQLFRPPYGQISPIKYKALQKLGYQIVMWDVLSKDWEQKIAPEVCLQNIIKYTEEGSILVFHDSIKASKNVYEILPKVLEYFSEKGYTFKSIRP